ncbi:hypothetical protein KSP39_PZI016371 [Platanthera zijinensis]|uniref:Uncharacterized protein n=1 Tax=Platanthera zijinensis TaxID=2320716 RepID=A0AAP0B6D4_9ASPA
MTSDHDEGATLLASLEASQDSRSLYLPFSAFFVPFKDFIFLDDYNPKAVKKKAG